MKKSTVHAAQWMTHVNSERSRSHWRKLEEGEYTPARSAVRAERTWPASIGRYGAAVDLGSSHIRVSLCDREAGKRLAAWSGPNPQAVFGADVLTRLAAAAASPAKAHKLSASTREAVGEAIQGMFLDESLNLRDAGRIVIVGNTAVLALLAEKNYELLLKPGNWAREIDCRPENSAQWLSVWGMSEKTSIIIASPLAGFVGSDLLADVLATGLVEGLEGALIVDFGVNTEIALWDGKTLWVTSAAGGPAFEGCGISSGMPAEPGAIYRANIAGPSEGFRYEVIDRGEPEGICGSGLVDIISCLLKTGVLATNGRIKRNGAGPDEIILPGPGNFTLRAADIDSVQRAKAAVSAGIYYLLGKAGMQIRDLQRICVCGAFGHYLDMHNAQQIGVIPLVPEIDVELCGNTALTGCELLLFDDDCEETLSVLREKSRIVNMSQARGYEDLFIESLPFRPMTLE